MKISKQCVVAIHYTLTNDEEQQLDRSGRDPLVYLHGQGSLITGLEQELDGKEVGDSFQATIEPAMAYGEIDPRLITNIPRTLLAGIEDLHVGMELQAEGQDGHVQNLIVDEIGEDSVTVNANHPLAGKTLHFDVTVTSVRQATEEEIKHGVHLR